MNREIFKVVFQPDPIAFERALNENAAEGFKIVPLTVSVRPGAYEAVMAKSVDVEREETEARAKRAGLHVLEGYGV